MADTLKLEVVTPEAVALSEDVDMVTLPGSEGEMGIYPMHVPLMTQIHPGELTFTKDGKTVPVKEDTATITPTGPATTPRQDSSITSFAASGRAMTIPIVFCGCDG